MKPTSCLGLLALLYISFAQAAAEETTGVVVTIKPLHSLVAGVIGNTGKAILLIDGNTSPHDFQLKPSQMAALERAKIIFYIDNSLESFLHHHIEALPGQPGKASVVQEAGLALLEYRQGHAWKTQEASRDTKTDAHGGHHNRYYQHHDIHVWLSTYNARKINMYVAKILSELYPGNHHAYAANARLMNDRLSLLDAELRETLSGVQDKPFVVFHDAYQYLEHAYALNSVGSIIPNPDISPSLQRLQEIRRKMRQVKVACVFREPQFSDRLVKTVIEGTDIKSAVLDPLGAELAAGEELYFRLLRNLAKNLKSCLD